MKAKIQKAKKVKEFTDTQLRIHNTLNNTKKPLNIYAKVLFSYLDHIRKGSKNWKKFTHLPLVSFVDDDEMEEIVFKDEKSLPSEHTKLVTSKGTVIATFHDEEV